MFWKVNLQNFWTLTEFTSSLYYQSTHSSYTMGGTVNSKKKKNIETTFTLKIHLPDELLNEQPRVVMMKTSGKGWRQVTWSYRIKCLCHSYKRKSKKGNTRQKSKFGRGFIGMINLNRNFKSKRYIRCVSCVILMDCSGKKWQIGDPI